MIMKGLWGKKIGMTQVFAPDGRVVPVTVIDVSQWLVTRLKTKEKDGYTAVQLGRVKPSMEGKTFSPEWLEKPQHYFSAMREVHLNKTEHTLEVGKPANIEELLAQGDYVDVVGITIGRGFQGGVKRHGFAGGPKTHGDGLGRGPGSMGFMRSRGRVIKGWNMAGHMGCDRCVMKNLEIVRVMPEVVLVKGSVPGKTGSLVFMRKCGE